MLGILFIILSNYFRILAPQLTGFVVDEMEMALITKTNPTALPAKQNDVENKQARYDVLVKKTITGQVVSLTDSTPVADLRISFNIQHGERWSGQMFGE